MDIVVIRSNDEWAEEEEFFRFICRHVATGEIEPNEAARALLQHHKQHVVGAVDDDHLRDLLCARETHLDNARRGTGAYAETEWSIACTIDSAIDAYASMVGDSEIGGLA